MLKIFKRSDAYVNETWRQSWSAQGILLTRTGSGIPLDDPLLSGYLAQLEDDGHAVETADGVFIGWDALYAALQDSGYSGLTQALALPPQTTSRPMLYSRGSLGDREFAISIGGWTDQRGVAIHFQTTGAILKNGSIVELMRPEQWRLFKEVVGFAKRSSDERNTLSHQAGWARIRKLAIAANARVDDLLYRHVVLSPEKLDIGLRKSQHVSDDNVIEVEPGFKEAPAGWLERFDSFNRVQDRYDITTPEGIVQVLITPQVRTVLHAIKSMPFRRVAGSRAQAFIVNPYAALGEDAKAVIVEEDFERAREEAGLQYERFLPVIERDATGYPERIGLLIESANANGPTSSETHWLTDDQTNNFVQKLETALAKGFQLLGWNGFDLELLGEAPQYLDEMKAAAEMRSRPHNIVTYEQIHDLANYSLRIEGIGIEQPYHSRHIEKEKIVWFPEGIPRQIIVITPPGPEAEPINIPVTKDALNQLRTAVQQAKNIGQDSVNLPGFDKPIPVKTAEAAEQKIADILAPPEPPEAPGKPPVGPKKLPVKRKSLILLSNIEELDYVEKRRIALQDIAKAPEMPNSISSEYKLLQHQCEGLAWLQHLYKLRDDYQVRGAVLADDMGLGKTFQLLAFMAWLIEQNPSVDPMLVVAPVSLLENWNEEANKFFLPGTLPILMAYGDALAALRVPRNEIDERLQQDGLVRFLKSNWVGNAKVVLTTYETLRDMEFSFAAQRWSIMVCDEAQRIKNPAAMVTRAAKKQNVDFKIACTGTPVENTLADLWCLFDYVQPGLLGALNDFGRRYSKPIEAKTEEEKARVDELRGHIAPQIKRRTKAEVAKDLPSKIIVDDCRQLALSDFQRSLYSKAVDDFRKHLSSGTPSPIVNHLSLLHYLRLICTDPRHHGLTAFQPEPLAQYSAKAPKLDWLLKQLKTIQSKGEKVIVFCEFRNIQRLLQHYISEAFKIKVGIINGDTAANAGHSDSRQKRIKAFQDAPGFGVLILSPVAVGFGVNIQGANHVVHYTRTWNPAKEDQATDRAYRIGQKKDVYVYYPVVNATDFNTFDVMLDRLLTRKRELAGDMLNGAGDVKPNDFGIDDVKPPSDDKGGGFEDLRVTLEMALRMDWRYFEGLAAALWNRRGFEYCYCTPGSADNGVDVVAINGDQGELIQTKTSGTDRIKLGWETVKELVAGEAFYRRLHPNVTFKKVGLTNQYFNDHAHENARLNHVDLMDQEHLARLLNAHSVTMMDIQRMIFTDWAFNEADAAQSDA
jgi:Holliday junction resolvase